MPDLERTGRGYRNEMTRRRFLLVTGGAFSLTIAAFAHAREPRGGIAHLVKSGYLALPTDYRGSYLDEVKRRVIPGFAEDIGRLANKKLVNVPPDHETSELADEFAILPTNITMAPLRQRAAGEGMFVAYGLGVNACRYMGMNYDSFTPLIDPMYPEDVTEIVRIAKLPHIQTIAAAPSLDPAGNRLAVIRLAT